MIAFVVVYFTLAGTVQEPQHFKTRTECVLAAAEMEKLKKRNRRCFEVRVSSDGRVRYVPPNKGSPKQGSFADPCK